MCCDSDVFLVDGRSWSRSCCLAVGVVGVVGTFSLPLTCVIPCADSCTIICTVRQRHRYKFGSFLAVMAGDCGDEIPSKSKPQPAGITSCMNFESSPFLLSHTPSSIILALIRKFFILLSTNFTNLLKIHHMFSFFSNFFLIFRTRFPFSCTFSASFAILLQTRLFSPSSTC